MDQVTEAYNTLTLLSPNDDIKKELKARFVQKGFTFKQGAMKKKKSKLNWLRISHNKIEDSDVTSASDDGQENQAQKIILNKEREQNKAHKPKRKWIKKSKSQRLQK